MPELPDGAENGRFPAGMGPERCGAAAGGQAGPAGGQAAGGPLAGVRVLDLTSVVMGPLATQILGDLGADVITIESARGDTTVRWAPGRTRSCPASPSTCCGTSGTSTSTSRPSTDAAAAPPRRALRRVRHQPAAGAAAPPAAPLRLPAAVRPDVIFCEAHGYPAGSGRGDEPAYDDIVQAASGVADAARAGERRARRWRRRSSPTRSAVSPRVHLPAALFPPGAVGRRPAHRGADGRRRLRLRARRARCRLRAEPPLGPRRLPAHPHAVRRPQRSTDGWIAVLPYRGATTRRCSPRPAAPTWSATTGWSTPRGRQTRLRPALHDAGVGHLVAANGVVAGVLPVARHPRHRGGRPGRRRRRAAGRRAPGRRVRTTWCRRPSASPAHRHRCDGQHRWSASTTRRSSPSSA